jgi:hypothetical protein
VSTLYAAKVNALETNRTRLVVMTAFFYVQGAAVLVAVVLSFVVAARR